jgi:hypothetical protein
MLASSEHSEVKPIDDFVRVVLVAVKSVRVTRSFELVS